MNYIIIAFHKENTFYFSGLDEKEDKIENIEIQGEKFRYMKCKVKVNDYIIVPIEFSEGTQEDMAKKAVEGIIKDCEVTSANGVVFLHGDKRPFSNDTTLSIPTKTYSGFNEYAYCLLDLVFKPMPKVYSNKEKCAGFPTWEEIKKNFFEPNWLEIILSPLLPLHLSLQAFFGISRDENNRWVAAYEKEEKEVRWNEEKNCYVYADDSDKCIKRNEDAFLLLEGEEGIYDFYADIFDRMANSDDRNIWQPKDADKSTEDNLPILELVTKMCSSLSDMELERKLGEYIKDENLLKLCALLANTDDYNVKYLNAKKYYLNQIGGEVPKHLKRGGDGEYQNLKNQLNKHFGEGKVKTIIKNIEEFAKGLETAIKKV